MAKTHDNKGKFAKGNPGGPGNPFAKRTAEIRKAIHDAVSTDDVREVIERLVSNAKGGDIHATKELLSRLVGPPVAADILERLEQVEAALGTTGKSP